MTSRHLPRRSATADVAIPEVTSPVIPTSPLSARYLDRSPDATPVPGNPNPKLATGIPSLNQAARRTSAPPSSFQKASDLAMTRTNGSPKTPATPKKTPSIGVGVAGGQSRLRNRTTSLVSNTPSLKPNGTAASVSGRSQRSTSMQLKGPPTKSPAVTRPAKAGRPSMESVTVVAPPEKRPSPSPGPQQIRAQSRSPVVEKRIAPSTPSRNPANGSPKVGTPRSPGVPHQTPVLHVPKDPHTTPKSTPSKTRPSPGRIITSDRPPSVASSAANLPGVPWTSSGKLHAPNGNGHLSVSINGRSAGGQSSYASKSMGPGLYGDEEFGGYVQHESFHGVGENGTDYDGGMTLDMVTEVDENEFDEDVGVQTLHCEDKH